VIPLVVHKCFCSSLLDYLSKLYYSSELFPALPLSAGEGLGVRLFFYYAKREDVKSSFTSSLLGYILFSVPLLSTPRYVHIHKDIVVSAPLPAWEGAGKSLLGDLIYYCPT